MAGKSGPSAGYHKPLIARAPETQNVVYQVCARVELTLPSACGHKKTLSSMLTYILGKSRCWPSRTGSYGVPSYLPIDVIFYSSGLRRFSPSVLDIRHHSDTSSQRLLDRRQRIKIYTMVLHNQGTGDHNRRSAHSCGGHHGCGQEK